MAPQSLQAAWNALQERDTIERKSGNKKGPPLFPRDAAALLGVTEGVLLASGCGTNECVRLDVDYAAHLQTAHGQQCLAIVRNNTAICECTDAWSTISDSLALQGTCASVSLKAAHIGFTLVIRKETGPASFRHSIQFFDKAGHAICKLFGLAADSLHTLCAEHAAPDQHSEQPVVTNWSPDLPRLERCTLIDTNIEHLLKESAAQAEDMCHIAVHNGAAELRINKCIKRVVQMHGFLNILDPGLDVHIRAEECSIARQCLNADGIVFGEGLNTITIQTGATV